MLPSFPRAPLYWSLFDYSTDYSRVDDEIQSSVFLLATIEKDNPKMISLSCFSAACGDEGNRASSEHPQRFAGGNKPKAGSRLCSSVII